MGDLVELVCENETFKVSKRVLCDNSDYFKVMFSGNFIEKDKKHVTLKLISKNSLKYIIDHLSSDKLFLNEIPFADLLKLLQDASMLQFTHFQAGCEEQVLTCINYENALDVLSCGVDSGNLLHRARAVALWYFAQIVQTSNFNRLNLDQVEGYLGDAELYSPSHEWGVWLAIEQWLYANSAGDHSVHSEHLHRLVQCLRVDKLDICDLQAIGLCPAVKHDPQMSQVIAKILERRTKQDSWEPTRVVEAIEEEADITVDSDDAVNRLVDEWLVTSARQPRRLPHVACVVGSVVSSPGKKDLHLIRFNEAAHRLEVVLRLDKMETSVGSLVGFKVLSHGCKLYLIGGEMLTRISSWNHSVWELDLILRRWSIVTNLPMLRRHMSACFLDNDLYVIGGFGKHRVTLDAVQKYSFGNGTWSSCAPLPTPMYSAACCTYQGCIYVVDSAVYQYQPVRGTWVNMHVRLPAGHGFCSLMPGVDRLYFATAFGTKVFSWDPSTAESSLEPLFELQHPCSQACLVGDTMYSLSQDEFGDELYFEKVNLTTGERDAAVTVAAASTEVGGVADLDPRHHHGCLSVLLY